MNTIKRSHCRWTVNELIQLQREYELLEMSIQQIAKIHKRSVRAILCRLEQEYFIENWEQARGFSELIELNDDIKVSIEKDTQTMSPSMSLQEEEQEEEQEDESISTTSSDSESITSNKKDEIDNRLFNLEKSFSYLSNMVKQLFEKKVTRDVKPKLQSLRKQHLDRCC
uniref:Uncharacterized protein n=1 Tax=viral metagenome TaxID=1070528 RepID=A0A6C0DGV5_9ZZZZ